MYEKEIDILPTPTLQYERVKNNSNEETKQSCMIIIYFHYDTKHNQIVL